MLVATSTESALAATRRFQVTVIRRIGFAPDNLVRQGSAGINNKGQIVYGYSDLVVVNTWGLTCVVGDFCELTADFNNDYVINMDDLLAVVNTWCNESSSECCANGPGSFGPSGPPNAEQMIDLVLESEQTSEVQAAIIVEILAHF
jgi:hypothetical protein